MKFIMLSEICNFAPLLIGRNVKVGLKIRFSNAGFNEILQEAELQIRLSDKKEF